MKSSNSSKFPHPLHSVLLFFLFAYLVRVFCTLSTYGMESTTAVLNELSARPAKLHPARDLHSSGPLRTPAPLSRLLPLRRPSTPRPPRDWKRPHVLAAHVTLHANSSRTLTLFTAGILLNYLERTFRAVGCLVGTRTYPAVFAFHEKVVCNLPPDVAHLPGERVSVVVALDERLQVAMSRPQKIHGYIFEIRDGDVFAITKEVQIANSVEQIAWSNGSSLVAGISSDISWGENLVDEEPQNGTLRYELCMVTVMKQYPHLLPEWIAYYRRMGVDRFYIYDNDAVHDLTRYQSPFVEVVYWPHARSQTQAFTHFLVAGASRCKYVGFFDADEFVHIGNAEPYAMKRYLLLRALQGFNQITFLFLTMHNNGYIRTPKGSLPELYTKRKKEEKRDIGKSVVDLDAGWDYQTIHTTVGGKNRNYYNGTTELDPKEINSNAMLVHFTERSWEEYVAKQQVGGASVLTKQPASDNLEMNKPKDWYMKTPTVEWLTFRDYWRKIMKQKDVGGSVLTWKTEHGLTCSHMFCSFCRSPKWFGVASCYEV